TALMTLPVGLQTVISAYGIVYSQVMAQAVLAALPLIVVFLLFQRQIIKGVATSGFGGTCRPGRRRPPRRGRRRPSPHARPPRRRLHVPRQDRRRPRLHRLRGAAPALRVPRPAHGPV